MYQTRLSGAATLARLAILLLVASSALAQNITVDPKATPATPAQVTQTTANQVGSSTQNLTQTTTKQVVTPSPIANNGTENPTSQSSSTATYITAKPDTSTTSKTAISNEESPVMLIVSLVAIVVLAVGLIIGVVCYRFKSRSCDS